MRRQFGIRWMARLLLVCMLVGLIPTGVFAIEGDSSSLAEDAPEYRRADTATEQALKSAIISLAAPVYTHNEKVDFYGTSQETFRKEADGSSYFFVNPNAGTEDLMILPETAASGKALKTITDFTYGNMGKTLLGVTPNQAWTVDHNGQSEVSYFYYKGHNGDQIVISVEYAADANTPTVNAFMDYGTGSSPYFGLYSSSTGLTGCGIFMWITLPNATKSTRYMLSCVDGGATFVNNQSLGDNWPTDAKGMMQAYKLVSMEELAELKAVLTQAAQKMNGAQYDEELYNEFLNYVDNSIDIYEQSNCYIKTNDMNDIYEVRDLLRERTETLQEYLDALEISALSTEDLVATLKTDVAGVAASTAGVYNNQLNLASLDLATLRGSFFIATEYNGWKIMDGDSTVGRIAGGRPAASVINDPPTVWIESMADGSPLNEAKAWNVFSYGEPLQGDGISMVFSMDRSTAFSAAKNSESIVVDNVSFTSGNLFQADNYTLQVYPATEGPNCGVKIYDTVDGVKYFLCLINHSDPAYVRYMWIAESEISNYDETQYIFYLFSHWNTNKLKTAITDAGALLDGDTTGYSKAIYDRFLRSLNSAVTLYNTYNKNEERHTVSYEEFIQDKLDRMTNELYGYITLLTSEEKYIDIPVEIIDFRADGLLIENISPFDLLRDGLKDPTTEKLSPVLPGNLGIPGVDGTGNYREGLTYGILVNDNFVYREEVIDYVAQGILLEGSMKEHRWRAALGSTQVIETRVEELLTSQNKGSMADTAQKLHGSIGANDQGLPTWAGGTLYWSQVETAYDLAYYVLSNLWSEVETGDVIIDGQVYTNRMEDGYYYNMTVPERSTLRMYMDENGEYALDAAYPVGYAGDYIMNAPGAEEDLDWVTTTSTTDGPDGQKTQGSPDDPLFAPIDGLGFEKDGVIPGNADTDRGSISNVVFYSKPSFDSNYHYTMHAYASFVYYEDQNQVFTFRGDDDVHFYINGKMAMDLGGAHTPVGEELELREHAEELGLVDGNTYRFDMFYAERAATGSNLLFSTNIKINDTDTRTEKMQYANTFGGTDQIGEDGRGSLLGDNAMMNIGDKVDYSFDIINTRKVPVFDISFRDESLGVSISPEAITLPDTMSITDLRVYYEPVDAEGNSSDDLPVAVTVADIERLIQAAIASRNDGDDPSKITLDKNYMVRIATAKELQDLLSLGIPAYCRISVYGFRRTMEEGDRPYMNTLESLCHYRQSADPETAALKGDVFPISATVSRLLQVPDVNVALPTADVEEIVIDYGKAVHIPMDELAAHVYGNAKAVVGEFAGLTAQGERNGELLKNAPGDLNSNSLATEEGLFTVKNGDLVYEPRTILTDVDKVYAAYNLSGCYGMDASGTSSVHYRYILVEIRITPATMMYYEAEDFADKGGYYDGGDTMYIDPRNIPTGAFFVDFNGEGYDDRYGTDPLYGNIDFDTKDGWSTWDTSPSSSTETQTPRMTPVVIDRMAGTASTSIRLDDEGKMQTGNIYIQSSGDLIYDYPLCYKPFAQNYVQIRFKLENFDPEDNAAQMFTLVYYYTENKNTTDENGNSVKDAKVTWAEFALPEEAWSGEYVTLCYALPDLPVGEMATAFRPVFTGLVSLSETQLGKLTIDYIYVGEKLESGSTSPINTVKQTSKTVEDTTEENRLDWGGEYDGTALLDINPDDLPEGAFFVDFDGRGYHDRYKKDELYGDCDFDDMNYWASLGIATDGSQVSTKLTVDKELGGLIFKATPNADTAGNYGPYLGTTRGSNVYPSGSKDSAHSYFPLNYRPQKTTYIQMRFKAENCDWAGNIQWIDFLYNYNKNGESIYSETAKAYIGLSYAVKEDGVYQTVCCEIPEDHAFYTADWIESFAFRFRGLKGTGSANGTITIDYIYVGTKPEKQQDFSRVEDTIYDMVMDRESIPSDAFYVDFDGEGYDARYKNGQQYGGYNFDEESAWYSHHVYDTSYNTHTLNEKAGTMELSNLTSTDEKGNPLGAWIQTIIPGKALGTTPLRLNAGQEHIAQIRFRVENCVSYNSDGNISLFFSGTSDSENSDKNVALDSRRARFALSHADVTKGDYITARFSLDNSYYANSDTIDIIRLYIAGYKDDPTDNKTGKIIIDYIYVGPKVGLPEDLEQHSRIDSREEYLFFDFNNTAADRLRYESPQYNGFNFDLVDNWEGRTTGWKDGTEFAADGTMTVRAGTATYSSIYIDTCVANGDDTRLLNYNAANAEVFQIRFRASNLIDSDGKVGAQIQFYADSSTEFKRSANGVGADGIFDVKYLTNGEYYTVTGKIHQAQRDLGTIKRIIVWIGDLDNTVNPAGTVTFDHVYVGPQDILDNINRELAEKEAKENTSDYLFFTFNNTDTDKLRYESPQYNSINFDSAANWEGRTTGYKDGTETVSNGAITVKAGQTGYSSIYIDSAVKNNDSTRALNYDPSNAEVFQIRFKASNLDEGTGSFGAEVQFYWDFGTSYKRSEKAKFDAKYLTNGEYYTVTGKITDAQRALGTVPRIIVWIGDFGTSTDTTGTVTFDHVYIGPKDKLEEINKILAQEEEAKSSEYLFFDFNNTGEDQLRYTAPQYNGFNFDLVANWEGRTTGWKDGTESVANGGLTVRAGGTNSYSGIYADTCVANGNNTRLLNYNAANAEVFQIRFKASNLKGTSGNFGAEVQLYADSSQSHQRSEKAKFDVKYLSNGEYITVSGRITDEQRKLGTVKRIIVWIGDMDSHTGTSGTVTFDHVYIGPADRLEEINRKLAGTAEGEERDHLFFGFDNTQMDTLRYSSPTYGVINHDSTANWYAEGNGVETIENGTVTFTDTVVNGYTYLSMGDKKLHYVIGEEDYCQIRFKISNDAQDTTPNDGQVSLALMFTTEKKTEVEGASAGYTYFKLDDYKGKGFVTLTFPLGNNDPAYAPGEILTSVRPQFGTGLDGGSYTIDYIYVGPLVDANPAQRSLFFDFDNTGDDRNRYNTDAYGFINYDETGNWTVNPDRDKSVTVDSDAGFLVVDPDENNENSFKEFSYFNTGSSNTYSWAYADCPLDFHPSAATVAQVRFKITGICMEPGAVSEADDPFTKRTKTEPYVQLRYFYDHKPLTDNPIAGTGFASAEALNQGEFVTVTFALDDAFRNCNIVSAIRPSFHRMGGNIIVDYIYVGPGELAPDPVYGYDSSYENDSLLSDGNSLFVEGNGIQNASGTAKEYTESTFSFKGTGFDIISRTGKMQATIRVEVKDNATGKVVKSLTVNNKGELELYQIPVVSVQGLPHGEYTVTLWVNKAVNSIYDFLSRGGEFYLDGIRIYDTVCVDGEELTDVQQATLNAYETDKEAYNYIKEVRNILLSADEFYALTDTVQGAVFVDVNSPTVNPYPTEEQGTEGEPEVTQPTTPPYISTEGYNAMTVLTYNKLGPKNEVYLAPDQAIAFMLQIDTARKPVSIDIGAKTIQGDPVTLAAGFVSTKKTDAPETLTAVLKEISTSTAQYYALDETKVSAGDTVYLVLYNATEKTAGLGETDKVLSITDIKIAYDGHPDTPLSEDQITDKEVFPTAPGESTGGDDSTDTGSDSTGGNGSGSGNGSGTGASDAGVKMLIGGDAVSAVRSFMVAIHETPVAEPEEPETPALQGDMRIYHSLNLASDISVNFLVSKADLAGFDLSSVYMECRKETFDGNKRAGYTTMRLEPVEKGEYYYFTLTGLTAVNMNDRIYTTLYGVKDGQEYYSATDDYSITDYAYSQLNKAGAKDALKTLCADLLRYGAKAQIFKSYRTDRLADADLTEEQKAYLSDPDAVAFGNTNKIIEDLDNAPIAWAGKALNLESKIAVKFIFAPVDYSGDIDDLTLRVSYEDAQGNAKTLTLGDPELYNEEKGYYAFTLDTLLAAELRTVISARIYSGNTPVSATLQYSPDTYGNNKTGTLLDLCKALFAYSDSAKAYFTN